MPGPVTYAPEKAFLGVAPETTPGTAVAPTFTIPYTNFKPEDKPKWLDDPSIQGSMAADYNLLQGVFLSDFSLAGIMYADTFPFLVRNILGDRTTTGTGDPYAHAISLLNSGSGQPKTDTLTHWTGIPASTGARQYTSACLSDLSIMWDAAAKLCTYTSKGQAWGSNVAAAQPTAAPSAVPALPSWRAVVGIGGPASGGTLVANVETGSIDFKRKIEPKYTLTGSQQPYIIQRGSLACSGKMTFIAANETPVTNILTAAQQQIQLVLSNGVTGAGQRQLQLDVQVGAWMTGVIDLGKTATLYEATWKGLANATNAGASGGKSPALVTITNGNAGTSY